MAFGALAAACTEDFAPFTRNQIEIALDAAEAFEPSPLMPLVQEIYDARITDPEQGTSHGDDCGTTDRCIYNRVATRALIRRQLGESNLGGVATVREQARDDGGFETVNVFVDFPGKTRPDEWVIATAHYDAWFGAANDNGTGVAVLLQVARTLRGLALDRSVRLLFTDGEELGMVGSGRYVQEYGTNGVVMVLNADSVAFVGTEGGVLTREASNVEYWLEANESSAQAAFQMANLARRLPEPVHMKPLVYPDNGFSLATIISGGVFSDHAQFWLAGVPALFPFPTGGKPDWYHTARDTPLEVNADRLRRVGRLWACTLAAFATVSK